MIIAQTDMLPGGAFELTDHFVQPVTEASFFGLFPLVFFGFTHCKLVCPENLGKLSSVLALLGDRARLLRPLYVSVDPARDTPERMRAFLEGSYPRFLGLTGDKARIDAMKRTFKVYADHEAADAQGNYDIPHTAITYLMGPDGRFLTHFVDALTVEEITTRLLAILPDVSSRQAGKDGA